MKVYNAENFGRAIKKRRKSLGYTQETVSDFTGVSKSFLSDLERGKPTVELEKVIRVALTLGMDIDLVNRGGNE